MTTTCSTSIPHACGSVRGSAAMTGVPCALERQRARRAGWPGRVAPPPPALLRADALTRWRWRWVDRQQQARPRLHARLVAAQHRQDRLLAAVLPVRRVTTAWGWAVGLTLFDALATIVVVGVLGVPEANPLLATLAYRWGTVAAMAVRAVVGVGLVSLLAWIAPWRPEARLGLASMVTVLAALALWHLTGTALLLGV